MNQGDDTEILKRLDALIGLLSISLPSPQNTRSLRDQIKLLSSVGLGPTAIGRIVGRPAKTVTSELAKAKTKGGKK